MLLEGDTLQLYLAEETMAGFMEEKTVPVAERHFGIVYEDDDILVVNKPAGLLTHPEKRRIGIPSQTRFCITSTKRTIHAFCGKRIHTGSLQPSGQKHQRYCGGRENPPCRAGSQ